MKFDDVTGFHKRFLSELSRRALAFCLQSQAERTTFIPIRSLNNMSTTIDLTSPSPQKKTKKRDLLDYYSLGKRKNTNNDNDNNENAGNGKKKKNLPKSGDILSVKAYLNVPFSEKDEVCLHICNAFYVHLLILNFTFSFFFY